MPTRFSLTSVFVAVALTAIWLMAIANPSSFSLAAVVTTQILLVAYATGKTISHVSRRVSFWTYFAIGSFSIVLVGSYNSLLPKPVADTLYDLLHHGRVSNVREFGLILYHLLQILLGALFGVAMTVANWFGNGDVLED